MQLYSWSDILGFLNTGTAAPYFTKGCGISVGSFDGLHKGHRELINTLVRECRAAGIPAGVVTFKRPLPSIKHSGDYLGDVSTLNQRLKLLEELGIDFAIVADFDESFASMLGTDFFSILINVCNMSVLAEGVDFRCGYKGATDSQAIKYFGEKNNIKTLFVDPVYYIEGTEQIRVSSSYIRNMIHKGFLGTVEELLERKYSIETGKLSGDNYAITQVLPPDGVYHCTNATGTPVRLEISSNKLILPTEESSSSLTFN